MGKHNRQKRLEKIQRQQQVADLRLQGWTQTAIAVELRISQSTVNRDLLAIQELWRLSTIRDFDEFVVIESQKINRMEFELWKSWFASNKPQQSADITENAGGN